MDLVFNVLKVSRITESKKSLPKVWWDSGFLYGLKINNLSIQFYGMIHKCGTPSDLIPGFLQVQAQGSRQWNIPFSPKCLYLLNSQNCIPLKGSDGPIWWYKCHQESPSSFLPVSSIFHYTTTFDYLKLLWYDDQTFYLPPSQVLGPYVLYILFPPFTQEGTSEIFLTPGRVQN